MKFCILHAGEKMYWFVWIDQWLSLLCSDIGLFILAGESLKVSNLHAHEPNMYHKSRLTAATATTWLRVLCAWRHVLAAGSRL